MTAAPVTAAPVTTAPVNVADELKKRKEILDLGSLTQEEFDSTKAKVLATL